MSDWRTNAPLGPWCITWDISNSWEDDIDRLMRAVIATWQPVPHSIAEYEPLRGKQYKDKRLGKIWL